MPDPVAPLRPVISHWRRRLALAWPLSAVFLFGANAARACPMCEAAAYWASIGWMFHGRNAADAGPLRLRG